MDAAVAVALTLNVVEPYNSGIGAGGLALIWDGDKKKAYALDFRETAPSLAQEKMFLQPGVPEDASRNGPLAIAVPGEMAGLAALHKRWGKLPWKDLFTEAIRYAEQGFSPDRALKARVKKRRDCLTRDYHTLKIYKPLLPLPNAAIQNHIFSSQAPLNSTNETLSWKQPELAKTLKRLQDNGAQDFYSGKIAQALSKDLAAKGSLIRLQDLQNYQIKWRKPLEEKYNWGQVWGFPLPSSGGILVLQALNTLTALEKETGSHETWASWLIPIFGEIFTIRNEAMGDSDFLPKPPLNQWLSKGFAKKLAKEILDSNSLNLKNGTLKNQDKENTNKTEGQTSHFSVIDAQGNAVSMTITQNLSFGSCVTAGSTGILMNNQMDDFATRAGQPNAFGLVQSQANAIQPGKRPLSSMSPILVTEKKTVILALGSPGGPRIISSVLQVLYRHFVLGENLKESVAAPRFHYQGLPQKIFIESTLPAKIQEQLSLAQLPIEKNSPWSNVQAVAYDPKTEKFSAESDPRGIGKAIVVYPK